MIQYNSHDLRSVTDVSKYEFSQRAINERNTLSNDCVNAGSVNMSTNKIVK